MLTEPYARDWRMICAIRFAIADACPPPATTDPISSNVLWPSITLEPSRQLLPFPPSRRPLQTCPSRAPALSPPRSESLRDASNSCHCATLPPLPRLFPRRQAPAAYIPLTAPPSPRAHHGTGSTFPSLHRAAAQ